MSQTLTKSEIVDAIIEKTLLPRNQASQVIEQLLEIMKKTLQSGEDVMISGFGKFSVKSKRERKGRNPSTGESMMLRPRKVVTFKSSKKLTDKLNDSR